MILKLKKQLFMEGKNDNSTENHLLNVFLSLVSFSL